MRLQAGHQVAFVEHRQLADVRQAGDVPRLNAGRAPKPPVEARPPSAVQAAAKQAVLAGKELVAADVPGEGGKAVADGMLPHQCIGVEGVEPSFHGLSLRGVAFASRLCREIACRIERTLSDRRPSAFCPSLRMKRSSAETNRQPFSKAKARYMQS